MNHKKKTLVTLAIIFVAFLALPMALVNFGVSILLVRILTLAKWLTVALILLWFLKPARKDIKCALLAGLIVGVGDFIGESLAINWGLWSYEGAFSFRGIPLDIPLDFFWVAFIFCLGYTLFKNQLFLGWGYVLGWAVLLSLWGYLVNLWAPPTGFILMAEKVAPGTAIFFTFFLIFGLFLAGLLSLIYYLCCHFLKK